MDWNDAVQDDRKVRLAAIVSKPGATVIYEYDIGDSWQHEVVVEEVTAGARDAAAPTCDSRRTACPPED